MKASLVSAAALCMVSGLAMAQSAGCCEGAAKAGECEVVLERVGDGAQADGTYELKAGVEDNGQLSLKLQRVGEMMAGVLAAGQPEAEVQSHAVMIQKEGDREVKVEVTNGRAKAWVNGEAVPEKRVKVTDQKISVLDGDGETIAEFGYSAEPRAGAGGGQQFQIFTDRRLDGPDGPIVWEGENGEHPEMNFQVFGDDGNQMFFGQPEGEHPSVMIGITMGSLDEAEADERVSGVLEEHEIDAEDVFVVQSVIEGTPADEAGLREGDVVVRVDGEWGVGTEQLREVLMEKEPGDMLELAVVRKGKLREIEVELAEWSSEALGVPMAFAWQEELPGMHLEDGEGLNLQPFLEGLRLHKGELGEDLEQQFDVIIKQLGEEGEEGLPRLDIRPRIQFRRLGEESQPQVFVQPAPTPRAAPRSDLAPDAQARLERIEARLEKLEHQIDRLINAMQDREQEQD